MNEASLSMCCMCCCCCCFLNVHSGCKVLVVYMSIAICETLEFFLAVIQPESKFSKFTIFI